LTTGYLDGPSGLELGGWVWDPARPGVRLRVEIVIDGVLLRRCTAFNYRPDLHDAGIGDGRHAWSVELPPSVFDGAPHTFEARTFPEGVPLGASPRRFQSRYTGSLDQIDNARITGTLRDESRPGGAALVAEVFGDSRYLGYAPANGRDGAFEIRLPAGFDARRVAKFELFARRGGTLPAATFEHKLPHRWWKGFRWKQQRHSFDTALGVPLPDFTGRYEITVRDYSWICPRVDLIDETGRYCGEPTNLAGCEHCYRKLGPRADWGSLLHHSGSVEQMRLQYREVLEKAELVHFPSTDAAQRIRRYAPGIQRAVIRETPAAMPPVRGATCGGQRCHVAFLGDARVLDACRWEATKRGDIPFEFVEPGHPEARTAFYANTSPDVDAAAVAMLIAAGHTHIVTFDLGACADHAHRVLPIHATPAQILDALCHA
jgi:hypothetical protein